uniref:Neurexin-1a n=1 Tax=Schistocephalus solidus TaxID=70667 RepID=A0A0X3PD61_SCHSO
MASIWIHLISLYFIWMSFASSDIHQLGPAIIFKNEFSTAVYPAIPLRNITNVYFEFCVQTFRGRLLYAENANVGTFISVRLTSPSLVRLELRLLTEDFESNSQRAHEHIVLSAPLQNRSTRTGECKWHSIDIRLDFFNQILLLVVDGNSAYSSAVPDALGWPDDGFGQRTYFGRLQSSLFTDASKILHFTASMEHAFVGTMRNFFVRSWTKKRGNNYAISEEDREPPQHLSLMIPSMLLNHASLSTGISNCYQISRKRYLSGLVDHKKTFSPAFDVLNLFSYSNGCPAGSLCLDREDGPYCGCGVKDPTKGFCSLQPSPPDMVFSGSSWLKYHPNPGLRVDTFAFMLRFKTAVMDGVILSAEVDSAKLDSAKLSVYLYKGSLILSIWSSEKSSYGTFKQQFSCQSASETCADGRWHDINVSSAFSLLQIDVDQRSASEPLPKAFHGLRMKMLILGGQQQGALALGIPQNISNFTGCFQHAFYHTGPNQIDFLHLLKEHLDGLQAFNISLHRCSLSGLVNGSLMSKTRRYTIANSMVTFTRPGGYLLLRGWKTISRGRIAFRLRTFQKNCLLLYSSSSWPLQSRIRDLAEMKRKAGASGRLLEVVNASDLLTGTDLFSLELREGYLVLLLNTGSGINEFQTESIWRQTKSPWFSADGKEHSVEIRLIDGYLQVKFDGMENHMNLTKTPRYTFLNLNGDLYVGGLPEELRLSNNELPPQVWSAHLRKDFIGCIGHLVIDEEPADLHLEAMATWARDHVEHGCRSPSGACEADTCAPGVCDEGWAEPLCECADTNRDGPHCKQEAQILTFNGFQGIEMHLSKLPDQSEAESLVLRFQTLQKHCSLFESASAISTAPDKFGLEIKDGRVMLFYNFGHKTWNVSTKPQISDGSWHTLRVLRRSRRLEVKVDDTSLVYNISDEATMLDSDYICIGNLGKSPDILYKDSHASYLKVPESDAFVGRLSQFYINGLNVMSLVRTLPEFRNSHDHLRKIKEPEASIINAWKDNIGVSASAAENDADDILEFPIQFGDNGGLLEYVLDPQKRCTTLAFFMKTRSTTGVIFTLLASSGDFIHLELVSGMLSIRYNIDIIRGQSTARNAGYVNNTSWHKLKFGICMAQTLLLTMTVNEIKHEAPSTNISINRPVLFTRLLLGGPPDKPVAYQPQNQLENQQNYYGCLATISVSQSSNEGEADNVSEPINPLRFFKSLHNVDAGCHLRGDVWEEDTAATCRPGVCGFGGRCVQQLKTYFCDCSMSGFTGPVCTDVATTVTFSESERGCAVLEFNPLRNTTKDAIAFGIQTKHREPVVLLHITSHSNSLDFLRIEMTNFRKRSVLRLTYNMGSGIQVLQDSSTDLADGNFHVIRVVRSMSTAKLQIDSEDVLEHHSPNANGTDFNKVQQIYIGCDPTTLNVRKGAAIPSLSRDSAANRFFVGHLTGLTLNGISLGDILIGESVPGLYLKMSHALVIDPSFTPNLRQSSHLPANDMEAVQVRYNFCCRVHKKKPKKLPIGELAATHEIHIFFKI